MVFGFWLISILVNLVLIVHFKEFPDISYNGIEDILLIHLLSYINVFDYKQTNSSSHLLSAK